MDNAASFTSSTMKVLCPKRKVMEGKYCRTAP